jgi:hypothetical protein
LSLGAQEELTLRLLMFTMAFIPEDYDSGEGDSAAHTFLLELSALLFDFGFRLHLHRSRSQEPGARFFTSQAQYDLDSHNNHPTMRTLELTCTQLEGAARQQGESRRVMQELLLQQGLLLRCLQGAHLLQPEHARRTVLLATTLIAPGLGRAAMHSQTPNKCDDQDHELAAQVRCSSCVSLFDQDDQTSIAELFDWHNGLVCAIM